MKIKTTAKATNNSYKQSSVLPFPLASSSRVLAQLCSIVYKGFDAATNAHKYTGDVPVEWPRSERTARIECAQASLSAWQIDSHHWVALPNARPATIGKYLFSLRRPLCRVGGVDSSVTKPSKCAGFSGPESNTNWSNDGRPYLKAWRGVRSVFRQNDQERTNGKRIATHRQIDGPWTILALTLQHQPNDSRDVYTWLHFMILMVTLTMYSCHVAIVRNSLIVVRVKYVILWRWN